MKADWGRTSVLQLANALCENPVQSAGNHLSVRGQFGELVRGGFI